MFDENSKTKKKKIIAETTQNMIVDREGNCMKAEAPHMSWLKWSRDDSSYDNKYYYIFQIFLHITSFPVDAVVLLAGRMQSTSTAITEKVKTTFTVFTFTVVSILFRVPLLFFSSSSMCPCACVHCSTYQLSTVSHISMKQLGAARAPYFFAFSPHFEK